MGNVLPGFNCPDLSENDKNLSKSKWYRSLFMNCPVSLCELDVKRFRENFDLLTKTHKGNLPEYLVKQPEKISHLFDLIKFKEANDYFFKLLESESVEQLICHLRAIFVSMPVTTLVKDISQILDPSCAFKIETSITTAKGHDRWVIIRRIAISEDPEFGLKILLSFTDITETVEKRDALIRRNKELALLYQAAKSMTASLDLDLILGSILDESCRLLEAAACSVWIIVPGSDELVCRKVKGPRSDQVRGWKMSIRDGLIGCVVKDKRSLNVPDTSHDERHYKKVELSVGVDFRSILTVPIILGQEVLGVIQILSCVPERFDNRDCELMESLAVMAATAITNARLYKQATIDNEIKTLLLREVNHRVKNSLSSIIGLIYAEQSHWDLQAGAKEIKLINSLINRVQNISRVHEIFSETKWQPMELSVLVFRIIKSSLISFSFNNQVSLQVAPCSRKISADNSQEVAILINELVHNTIKYGLGIQEKCCICVDFEESGQRVKLCFSDNGPGFPNEVLEKHLFGVGFKLIETIVTKTLNGSMSLSNENGVRVILDILLKEL